MKYLTTTLFGCALALTTLTAEEDKPQGDKAKSDKPVGGAAGRPDGSFFRSLDKDDDKAISKEEAGDKWERLGKLDKNADGKVDMREMMAARPGGGEPGSAPGAGRPEGARPAPGEMFKLADKNNDGKITSDEVPAEAWERISKLDKDTDGAVTAEEARAGAPAGAAGGGEMFARADKNKDGKLSKDEVPAEMWERLSKLDKDSDNLITREEMAAMMKGRPGAEGLRGGPGAGSGEGGAGPMFSRFDTDKDGKLSKTEVPAEMWDKLSKADDDADGLISKEELEKVYKARDGGGPRPEKKPEGDSPKEKAAEADKVSA